jgi:hypothetical protein
MREDLVYGQDPQGRLRFFGLYGAKVISISDPLKKNRVQVQVFQTTGTQITGWAAPCLPITSNSNHPDHIAHTAAQVAALLSTHDTHSISVSGTTGAGGTQSHTHSFSASTTASHGAHSGVSGGKLEHPHKTVASTTEKWNDSQETNTTAEHSPHRLLPRVGQLVWVMFAAGDPEYPVWIGVQS